MIHFLPILTSFFSKYKVLVGKPILKSLPNKIVLQMPYFVPVHSTKNNPFLSSIKDKNVFIQMAQNLSLIIETHLNSSKILEFRLIRLHYPYLDSFILSQYL